MAFEEEEDHHVYNDDDLDDDDEDSSEPLNGGVLPNDDDVVGDSESSDDTTDSIAAVAVNSTAVTVAIPSSIATTTTTSAAAAPTSSSVTIALPDPKRHRIDSSSPFSLSPVVHHPEKKPIDDSRRLFQRLWTDEDEIELLQGFLEYTSSRGTTSSGHHHDTAAFYDQIKSKLQLEFNKNQLVEKLRRLKKKYRNVLSKMSSGKEFAFKSPHDQATFEISKKIWTSFPANHHHRTPAVEFDDDEQHQNPSPNPNPIPNSITAPTPHNSSFIISPINLNNAAVVTPTPIDHKPGSSIHHNNHSNAVNFDMIMSSGGGGMSKLSSRKRPRVGKPEEKFVRNLNLGGSSDGVNVNAINNSNNVNNSDNNIISNVGASLQGMIEETLKSCLSPSLFKEMINNAVNGPVFGGSGGIKGVGALAMNAIPLNFAGVNMGSSGGGEGMDEKWRKQQILELEVYSKRLELVQDQIKSTLEELRSMGS